MYTLCAGVRRDLASGENGESGRSDALMRAGLRPQSVLEGDSERNAMDARRPGATVFDGNLRLCIRRQRCEEARVSSASDEIS